MTAKSKPALAKFLRDHVRVDWYPTGRAVQAIERFRQIRPDAPMRAIVDALVVAGIKALAQVNGD